MTTVRDVANRAGVSPATVSRAMGSEVSVSPELRKRVLTAARELGYRPNSMAQSLRRGQSSIVALLVGDIEQSHFSALTKQVQLELAGRGLELMLHDLAHREERLAQFLEAAPHMQLRGIVLASSDVIGPRNRSLLHAVMAMGIGVVVAGQDLTKFHIPSVVHDERGAARFSVEYLIRGGARRVAYLGRVAGSAIGNERLAGYFDALAAAHIPRDDALIWDESFRYSAGLSAVKRAIAAGVRFDAIQAGSDELAIGAMAGLHDQSLRVPEDVEVIGFGNVEMSGYFRPGLTTLTSHPEEMARHIGELLDSQEQAGAGHALITIERGLVRRQSA